MKTISPTKLRQNLYRVIDQVVKTGEPIAIERKGLLLQITPPKRKGRFDRLVKRSVCRINPQDLVHLKWEKLWKPKSF